MTTDHDDRPVDDGVRDFQLSGQRPNHRRRLAVGAVGLAVLLGSGAYLITTRVADGSSTAETKAAVPPVAPLSATASPVVSGKALSPAATIPATAATARAAPPISAHTAQPDAAVDVPEKVKTEISAAREDAEKAGYPLRRALTPKGGQSVAASQRNETTAQGTLRVTTARGDLTGQKELLWAGDNGVAVGAAQCTQNFRFSSGDKPRVRPTMMLCWRTSADRSVVTLAIAKRGRPSAASNADIIAREWSRLG